MARTSGQKLKLLILKDYLLKNTDENHAVTVKDILTYLESCGISAERKSIYDDMESLRTYGLDICAERRDHSTWYNVVSRPFEISELKLLVDAVQGSRFITEKKSAELTKKLEALCSRYEGYELERQLTVVNRIKSMNESIYYNVDKIHNAIKNNCQISFLYFYYNAKKEKVYKRDGELYTVSPFALNWDDENYYLVGYDERYDQIRHYRVDKMAKLTELDGKARKGAEKFKETDVGNYSRKVFSMFGGVSQKVRLEFAEKLASVVIDRFGKDIYILESKDKPGYFNFETEIVVSPQFYGWLFSFGKDAKIIYPQSVKDGFCEYLTDTVKIYNN